MEVFFVQRNENEQSCLVFRFWRYSTRGLIWHL